MPHKDGFDQSYWAENWSRTYRGWREHQALFKFGLVVLAIMGLGWLSDEPKAVAGGLVLAAVNLVAQFLVFTPAQMWDDSTRAVAELRDRLRPRVSFVFDPETIPYQQHFGMTDGRVCRLHRIGVRNESAAIIKHVRVVVERVCVLDDGKPVDLATTSPLPLEHALNVMGIDRKDGYANLAPGPRPTLYVDVVEQFSAGGRPDATVSLCYANGFRAPLRLDQGPWVITLRVEGGNAFAHTQLQTDRNASGSVVLRHLATGADHRLGRLLGTREP
jgi:hypothetical protein